MLISFATAPENFPSDYSQILLLLISTLYQSSKAYGCVLTEGEESAILGFFNNGFVIDWKQVPQEYRVPFLQKIASLPRTTSFYLAIQHAVYIACKNSYAVLTQEEKQSFFSLLIQEESVFTHLNQQMMADLLQYASQNKIPFLIERQLIQCILKYQECEKNILKALLAFFNTREFPMYMYVSVGKNVYVLGGKDILWGDALLQNLFKYLSDNISMVSNHSSASVQLCSYMALKKASKEAIGDILQQVNMSAVREFEEILKDKHPLSPIFQKDPDRFLTTASEEQLELYYAPQEKKLVVDLSHIQAIVGQAQEVPPLPDGSGIQLAELEKMFDEINFTNKNLLGYVDPHTIEDDGELLTVDQLRGSLRLFVKNIADRTVPYAPVDMGQKEAFYQNLNRYLGHSVLALRTRGGEDRSGHLIWLATAGLHCGGRYFEVGQDLYYQLTGAQYSVDGESLKGGLCKLLAARRSHILKDQIRRFCRQEPGVHSFALAMKTVGKWFNVPEAESYQYQDPGVDSRNMHFQTQKEQNELYQACLQAYTPTLIINELYKHIEGIAGHPRTIKAGFRDTLDTWFKDKAAEKKKAYKQDPSLALSERAYHPDTYRIMRCWMIYMLQRIGILEKPSFRNFWHLGRLFQKKKSL